MTDHPTVSNFSCTHKAKGEGGRGAVGAAAGDSEVVLTLCVCPLATFLWQKQAKKLQRPEARTATTFTLFLYGKPEQPGEAAQ